MVTIGKYVRMQCQLNGMCVDLRYSSVSPGQRVVAWMETEELSQLWWEDKFNHCIRSRLNEDFVLTRRRKDNWLVVDRWEKGNEDQQFVISGKFVHRLHDEAQVMDQQTPENGSLVYMYNKHGRANQCWDLILTGPRYCILRSGMNNRILGVKSTCEGANVETCAVENPAEHHDDKTVWWEDENGYLRLKPTRLAMSHGYGDSTITCNKFDDPDADHWRYDCVEFSIKNDQKPSQCAAIHNSMDREGANIVPETFSNQANQCWYMTYY